MVSTFTNLTVNTYPELTFMAGTYKEITNNVFTSASAPINMTNATVKWTLSPYVLQDYVVLTKYGENGASGSSIVKLMSSDTLELGGKYIQRAAIVGLTGYEYRLGQGIVNITPAIRNV